MGYRDKFRDNPDQFKDIDPFREVVVSLGQTIELSNKAKEDLGKTQGSGESVGCNDFLFYEKLPSGYEHIRPMIQNSCLSKNTELVVHKVADYIDRLYHLRRNYDIRALRSMPLRVYPSSEQGKFKLQTPIHSLVLDKNLMPTSENIHIEFYPPGPSSSRRNLLIRLYIPDLQKKEWQDSKKLDKSEEWEMTP